MPYFIRLEEEEDLKFLQGILDQSVMKLKTARDPEDISRLSDIAPSVYRLHDAVGNAVKSNKAAELDVPDEALTEKDKKSTKNTKTENHKYNLCKQHPYYAGQRAPQKDCKGCWGGYKKMRPERYDTARRKFELKHKK